MPPPIRAFIAYDFALSEGTMFDNTLEDALTSQPPELDIHYPGANGEPKDQGTIWDSMVRREIGLAQKVLAFIDLPNANVGFEIGYAFGSGKHVGVYRYKSTEHRWLRQPPLRGHFRFQASSAQQVHQAFLKDNFIVLKDPPAGGDGVILLCPEASGSSLLKQVDPAWGWATPPFSEWDIVSMPRQFKDAGLVVWIITAHGEGPAERDGTENTALSILAGYAEARPELNLKIFVHKQARPVADVEHVARRFSTNSELKTMLTAVNEEWQTTLADRKAAAAKIAAAAAKPTRKKAAKPPAKSAAPAATPAPAPAAPPLLCPHGLPPHPHDLFPDTASRFIGREAQLGTGADAVQGMLERFKNPGTRLTGGRAVQWLWAHGFGGMGKSWCLHRIRCIAQDAHPEIRALIIDWDKPEWLAPLAGEPRTPVEIFDLIAIRLCQCLQADEGAIIHYREAKARIAATAAEHRRVHDRFEQHLQLAGSGDGAGAGDLVRRLRDEGLWHDDPAMRAPRLKTLRESRLSYREVFTAWCNDCGEADPAVICPTRVLADGLRACLSAAMQQHPLIVVLDTCEILQEDLDFWLRELFGQLITAAAPVLLLCGSRLRPDLHQPKGSRFGWLTNQLPATARRIEDFGESLRFPVFEIEQALDMLTRPLLGDHERLAVIMHRITLGVPLAVRGLLDLHEEGDAALTDLSDPDADEEPLSEKKAVETVIADVCERWLLNLEARPERAADLQDLTALALLPVLDQGLLSVFWQLPSPYTRLRDLSRKYSLLTDGDLHPTVRNYLRRHWRAEKHRPECLPQVLESLALAHAHVSAQSRPSTRVQQVQHRITTLNLRSWREADAIVPDLARALCLARVYEVEDLTLETLLSELPLAGPSHAESRKLWHRDDSQRPSNEAILPWLISQHTAATQPWTDEEAAALSLLQGCDMQDFEAAPSVASAAMDNLERAVAFFSLESLPLSVQAGEAFFSVGKSLEPNSHRNPIAEFVQMAAAAYERAIALHCSEAAACNNIANLYCNNLYQPERAEQSYLRAIELDPKMVHPHNGLGVLYQHYLNQPERAEQSYLRAIELDPKFAFPHDGLGDLYQHYLNQPKRAEQSYLRAIELDPKFAFPHNGLGDLYQYYLNQPERAEQSYLRAIELDPKFANPHNGLGSLYTSAGRWSQAVAEFSLYNTLDATSGGGCRGLAWVVLRSGGAVEEAQEWARQACERVSAHPGNDLLSIALEAWAGTWASALERWAAWVRGLPPQQDWFVRGGHDRIAALLRRVHAAGHLSAWVAELRAARPCWQPYVHAADAFLPGPPFPAPAAPLAATILQELQTPDPPATP